jgi:hypothetical protein
MDSAPISVASLASPTGARRPERRADGTTFSYADAAAALAANAARALEAHGAAPKEELRAPSGAPNASAMAHAPRQSAPAVAAAKVETAPTPTPSPAANSPASTAAPATAPAALPATPAPVAAPIISAPAPSAAAPAAREAAAKARLIAKDFARFPAKAPAPTTVFADILAKRLDKSSVFDLRLDPPELGRVEGRLSVDDAGKAVLRLAFDNEAAFDLYSHDEAALRQALIQSGLEFEGGDFAFVLRHQERSPDAVETAEPTLEHACLAAGSAGALDIRI